MEPKLAAYTQPSPSLPPGGEEEDEEGGAMEEEEGGKSSCSMFQVLCVHVQPCVIISMSAACGVAMQANKQTDRKTDR